MSDLTVPSGWDVIGWDEMSDVSRAAILKHIDRLEADPEFQRSQALIDLTLELAQLRAELDRYRAALGVKDRIIAFLHQCVTDEDEAALEFVCKGGLLVDFFATAAAGATMPCPVCRPDDATWITEALDER